MSETFFFAKALAATLGITALGFGLGFCSLGLACVGLVRSPQFRGWFLRGCRFFQAVPFLILLFWIYFGWGYIAQTWNMTLSPFSAGVIALGVSFLCFSGEALAHALDHLGVGLRQSAESLNVRGWAFYRWILAPELWAQMGGITGNLLLTLMKESALVSALGVFELTRAGQVYSELSGNYFSGSLISLCVYWLLAELLQKTLLQRMSAHA